MSAAAEAPAAGDSSSRLDLPPTAVIELLSSLHRLFKVARMYDKQNQALTGSADAVITATNEFCAIRGSDSADLMFANDTVFANGQMLQMPRDVYDRVMELGSLLEKCDVANVNIARTASATDLVGFVHTLGNVLRDPTLKSELAAPKYGGIRARPLRWRAGLEGDQNQTVVSRVLRTYASAVVVLRRFYAAFGTPGAKLPLAIRRLAQRIVTHAEQEPPLLVALAAAKSTGSDEAALAVTSALVAVLMARQLTTERTALTDLVLAALLHDVGRRRLTAASGGDPTFSAGLRPLSDDEKGRLAPSDALASVALEGISELTVARTVVSFEAHWQTHAARLGALYEGRRPVSVLGRILSVARAFSELMVAGPHSTAMGPDDAIQFLASRATDDTVRLYVRLLTGGLGIFPAGTSVELNTGEIAVVTAVPEIAGDFARPPVRVMYDSAGNALAEPFDVDLATEGSKGPRARSIKRALDTDAQQTQAMRAFVLSVTRGDSSKRERPPPSADAESGKRAIPPERPPVRQGSFDEMTMQVPPSSAAPLSSPQVPPAPPSSQSSAPRRERERPRFVDSRAEEGSAPPLAVDVVAARDRTRPPVDISAVRERTRPPLTPLAPRERSRPPLDPAAPPREDPSFGEVAPRERTRPSLDAPPRAAASVEPTPAPRVRSRPPVDEGPPPRVRSRPPVEPLAATPRVERTLPPLEEPPPIRERAHPPVEVVAPRVRSRPPIDVVGPLPRPATNPMAFRPLAPGASPRPRTLPGASRVSEGASPRPERPAFFDPRSEPDDDVPSAPAPPPSRPVAPPSTPSLQERRARPPVQAASNAAPTVAREWSDFAVSVQPAHNVPEPPPSRPASTREVPSAPASSPRPPAAAATAASNTARTVAREWSDFEPSAPSAPEGDEDDYEPSENPTRKANWAYDKLVAETNAAPPPAAKATVKVKKSDIDAALPREPKDKK